MEALVFLISWVGVIIFLQYYNTHFKPINGLIFMLIFIVGCIIIPLTIVYFIDKIRLSPKNNNGISKNDITNKNKYLNEKKDQIEKIFDEKYKDIEIYRKKIIYLIIVLILCITLSIILRNKTVAFISIIVISSLIAYFAGKRDFAVFGKYTDILEEVLHDYNSDLEFRKGSVFTLEEYYTCLFPEKCDNLYQEDLIINNKNDFYYSEIRAGYYGSDDTGTLNYQGSLARTSIKNTNCKIFLGSTSGKLIYGNDEYKKLVFENDEFNKLFQACTDNEVLAYKLLTPDVMEQFVYIWNNTFGNIDIRIINDKLYVRFLSGDNFNRCSYNKKKEKKDLCQSIAVLDEVMNAMEKIKNIINNKNMD